MTQHRCYRLAPLCLTLAALSALAALPGCANAPGRTAGDYETIDRAPHRDSEVAQRQNQLALEHLQKDELVEAEQALKRALAADVMFGPGHNNLGNVYFRQGKLYLAAWEFQYAAKLLPHHAEPRNNLGLVFEAVGKLDDAVDWYNQAITLESDNPQIIGNLARARLRRGDRDPQTRRLLEDLVLKDTRAAWIDWAREKLALMGRAHDESTDEAKPDEGKANGDAEQRSD